MKRFSFKKYFGIRYLIIILYLLYCLFAEDGLFFFFAFLIFATGYNFFLIKRTIKVKKYLKNENINKLEKDLAECEYKFDNFFFTKNYIFGMEREIFKLEYKNIAVIESEPQIRYLNIEIKSQRRMNLLSYDDDMNCYKISTPYFRNTANDIKEFILKKNSKVFIGNIKYYKGK